MLKPNLVPGRTLRVGVVGARRLDPAKLDHLRHEIDKLLRDVDSQATRQRIAEMDCAAPLASQALGAELASLGQSLMEATPGWESVVRARVDGVDQMFDPLADVEKRKAKLPVNGVDNDAADVPAVVRPGVPLERLPRHRVPRGKVRSRR